MYRPGKIRLLGERTVREDPSSSTTFCGRRRAASAGDHRGEGRVTPSCAGPQYEGDAIVPVRRRPEGDWETYLT